MQKENKEDLSNVGDYIGIDYIKRYVSGEFFSQLEINNMEKEYKQYVAKWNKDSKNKKLFSEIANWYVRTQREVEKTIDKIYDSIKSGSIDPSEYKNFMYYILQAKNYVDNQNVIDDIKILCIQKLEEENIDVESIINSHFNYDVFIEHNDKRFDEYKEFKKEFDEKVKNKKVTIITTKFNSINELSNDIINKHNKRNYNNMFLANYNKDVVLKLLNKASSEEIMEFRIAISGIYKYANNKELYFNDRECIKFILDNINNIINDNSDKIIKHMLELLKNDLNNIYNQISG